MTDGPGRVKLFVCGDVMTGRGIDQILPHPSAPRIHESFMTSAVDYVSLAERGRRPIPRPVGYDYIWGEALNVLARERPDARIINLETSITRRGEHDPQKGIHYRVSPENAACLTAARIGACTLANNHVLDWGEPGLLDTLDTLDRLHIQRCGAGRDLDEAIRPAVIELGDRGRIAVFSVGCADAGVPPWWAAAAGQPGVYALAELDDDATRQVRRAIEPWRRTHTIIVLSIHWGPNWGFEVSSEHRRFAHRMIDDAGVDLVHGHSSHHVKGIEVHHGRPILYGCGDLLTDYEGIRGHEVYRGDLGLLYLVTLDETSALAALEMVPTRMHRFRITQAGPKEARWLATTLARAGGALGTSVAIEGQRLKLRW
ncbi:MAG TPA: CapA family protein [Kofleriaceae bacterium]|nr:CapA family protein [Kofleriaceae bacterium]